MMGMDAMRREPAGGRTAQKRDAILTTATRLFLRSGFRGTSMDEIASQAEVSKQTVYKQFADKEQLFRTIIEGVSRNADAVVVSVTAAFGDALATTRDELEARLHRVARVLLDGVLEPRVLALRRLIVAEADQFPDLARSYYEQGPARGIDVIADGLQPYVASGLIAADDLRLAAAHLAHLALAIAHDRALFAPSEQPADEERDRLTTAAVRVFLLAYGATDARRR